MTRPEKVKAVEDTVVGLVEKHDQLTLLTLYKALYSMGFRITSVDGEIQRELRQWEKSDDNSS
jgi:hypothetical protein